MSLPDTCPGAALLRVVLVTVLGALPARPPSTAWHAAQVRRFVLKIWRWL